MSDSLSVRFGPTAHTNLPTVSAEHFRSRSNCFAQIDALFDSIINKHRLAEQDNGRLILAQLETRMADFSKPQKTTQTPITCFPNHPSPSLVPLNPERVSDFLVQLLREYEWRHVSFIMDENDLAMLPVERSIKQTIREEKARGFDISHTTSYFLTFNNRSVNHTKHLLEASFESRGVCVDGRQDKPKNQKTFLFNSSDRFVDEGKPCARFHADRTRHEHAGTRRLHVLGRRTDQGHKNGRNRVVNGKQSPKKNANSNSIACKVQVWRQKEPRRQSHVRESADHRRSHSRQPGVQKLCLRSCQEGQERIQKGFLGRRCAFPLFAAFVEKDFVTVLLSCAGQSKHSRLLRLGAHVLFGFERDSGQPRRPGQWTPTGNQNVESCLHGR